MKKLFITIAALGALAALRWPRFNAELRRREAAQKIQIS